MFCSSFRLEKRSSIVHLKVSQGDKLLGSNPRCSFLFFFFFLFSDLYGQEKAQCFRGSSESCQGAGHRHLCGQSVAASRAFGMKVPRPSGNAAVASDAQHAKLKHGLLRNVSFPQVDQKGR